MRKRRNILVIDNFVTRTDAITCIRSSKRSKKKNDFTQWRILFRRYVYAHAASGTNSIFMEINPTTAIDDQQFLNGKI